MALVVSGAEPSAVPFNPGKSIRLYRLLKNFPEAVIPSAARNLSALNARNKRDSS
jgi:hypothetical protein